MAVGGGSFEESALLEFNRLLQYYQNMPDIDLNAPEKGNEEREREGRNASATATKTGARPRRAMSD